MKQCCMAHGACRGAENSGAGGELSWQCVKDNSINPHSSCHQCSDSAHMEPLGLIPAWEVWGTFDTPESLLKTQKYLLVQPFKLFFTVRTAIISCPGMTNGVFVELKHIHYSNLSNNAAEQVRALISTSSFKTTRKISY